MNAIESVDVKGFRSLADFSGGRPAQRHCDDRPERRRQVQLRPLLRDDGLDADGTAQAGKVRAVVGQRGRPAVRADTQAPSA